MFVNISAYKFVSLEASTLPTMRQTLLAQATQAALKGTILLSPEGINLFLAGTRDNIDSFIKVLKAYPEFNDLWCKESESARQPFSRMLVRLKKEIIAFGEAEIQPEEHTAPHLSPKQLKQWVDEGEDIIILDTRNTYEVELGTFDNAIHLDLNHFREFPEAVKRLPEDYKDKPIVTFCTGGIRCEKAAAWMEKQGFRQVYQLNGGILNYFEQCGGDHYHGECFVFDQRVAVDPQLQETATRQCFGCRGVVTERQPACPSCGETNLIG